MSYVIFSIYCRFITYLPQIKVSLHFGNVVELENDFIIASAVTPFTVSVSIVVAGTLFLIIYDVVRWWKKSKKLMISPIKTVPYINKKFVHTLREHKEVFVCVCVCVRVRVCVYGLSMHYFKSCFR